MFIPVATSISDPGVHDNKVPGILKCSCGYHSNTRQHVRTCQICNIVYPIKIVDVAFMVRVSQTISINVQTGKLMLATSFSG